MNYTHVNNEGRERIIQGVTILADAVGSTLGALGNTVFIQDDNGQPLITKDGKYVSDHVVLSDPEMALGANAVKQAAAQTAHWAGDGTTTSTVLAREIIVNGSKSKFPSISVVKGINDAVEDVIDKLESVTKDLDDKSIRNIAYVSTNNDKELSDKIADLYIKCGEYGDVSYQIDDFSSEVKTKFTTGSYLPMGMAHPSFGTETNDNGEAFCVLRNPYVLVSNATIKDLKSIEQITQHCVDNDRALLIIAKLEKEVQNALVMNNRKAKSGKKRLVSCPVVTTFPDVKLLKELAVLVNAKYFDDFNGEDLSYVTPDFLGEMEEVVVFGKHSVFKVSNPGDVEQIKKDLKALIDNESNEYKRKEYQFRMKMVSGSFGEIFVGAPTKVNRDEILHRVEDATKAINTAKLHGYLPGGGVALRDISDTLGKKEERNGYTHGYNALLESIKAPYHKILENGGIDGFDDLEFGHGYDVTTGLVVNMVDAGIIDPAGVTKSALKNAASAATSIISTKTVITKEGEGDEQV